MIWTTETLVWTVFFAVVAAVAYTFFMQRSLGGLVKRLTGKNAVSPEKAQTLDELGYRSAFVKAVVRFYAGGGSPVARGIVKTKPEADDGAGKTEADSDLLFASAASKELRYHIPSENRTKCFEKHAAEKAPLVKLAGMLALLFLAAFVATSVIDFLGGWATDLVGKENKGAVGVTDSDNSLLEEQEKLNREEQEAKKREEEERLAKERDGEQETDVGNENETVPQTGNGDGADS